MRFSDRIDLWLVFFLFYLLLLLIQIRTHAIRKAHENIDKTLKAAEVILAQFDLSRQVCFLLIP